MPSSPSMRRVLALSCGLAFGCGNTPEPAVGTGDAVTDPATPHVDRSLALELEGDLAGALAEAHLGVEANEGSAAAVQAGKLEILRGHHQAAIDVLTPVVAADAGDARAQ